MRRLPAVLALLAVTAAACGQSDLHASTSTATSNGGATTVEATQPPAAAAIPTTPPDPPTPTPSPGPLAGRRICLDPGHDAYWAPGATGATRSGSVPRHQADNVPLYEHELTLSVAYRLAPLLEAQGAAVCVTRKPREEGGGLQAEPYDFNGDGRVRTSAFAEDNPERQQPRIDQANAFSAEVLVSVHFNGAGDRSVRGTEVYYSDTGPHEADNHRLSRDILDGLLAAMRESGFLTTDRGLRSDRYQRYSDAETARALALNAATIRANGGNPANCADCLRLVVNGNNPMSRHPGSYASALVEVEFLSNPDVVEGFILRADSLDVIAAGFYRGIMAYFGQR